MSATYSSSAARGHAQIGNNATVRYAKVQTQLVHCRGANHQHGGITAGADEKLCRDLADSELQRRSVIDYIANHGIVAHSLPSEVIQLTVRIQVGLCYREHNYLLHCVSVPEIVGHLLLTVRTLHLLTILTV